MNDAGTADGLSQVGRIIALDSTLGTDVLLLTSVEGQDSLSHCFCYTIEFATQAKDAQVRALIGQAVTIWLKNDDPDGRQPVNGLIRRMITRPLNQPGYTAYRAEVVPRLWFLDCTSDCRIFQDVSYPDIVKTILDDYGVQKYQFKLLKTDYPVAEYCVQYRESALAFISRLMEQVGIFYFHEHTADGHTLIMTDANSFTPYLTPQELDMVPNSRSSDIQSLAVETMFRPGAWTLADYDFEGPTKQMVQQTQTSLDNPMMLAHERFDFPGGYTEQSDGEWLAELRMEAEEAQFNRMLGEAQAPNMLPGYRFDLEQQGVAQTEPYLLTEVRHSGREVGYFPGLSDAPGYYRNEFVAIAAGVPFRPLMVTPKSVMRGAQTAMVVSPSAGDPIQVDAYGRIKVHFYWDRRGQPSSGATSCWVRVAQISAGAGFGSVAIPHAGQEVVVDFLEGDPDRPLIVGRVHNADKMPPYDVPGHKNKTIQRDHGGNKFVMDGESGGRHLSLIAPAKLNLFAIGTAAQSLSAAATGSAYSLPVIGLNPNFKNYGDLQTAINDAYNADQSSGKNSTSLNPSTTEIDGVETSDSNSVTEGNYNSWKGGNNNSWTMKMSYTYNGEGTLSITMADANSFVLGSNFSNIDGADTKVVLGFATSIIFGFNTSAVGGLNTSMVMGGDLKFVLGASETIINGPILKWNKGATMDIRNGNVLEIKNGIQYAFSGKKIDIIAPGGADPVVGLASAMATVGKLLFSRASSGAINPVDRGMVAAKPAAVVPPPAPDVTRTVAGKETATIATGWTVEVAAGGIQMTAVAGDVNIAAAAGNFSCGGEMVAEIAGLTQTTLGNAASATNIYGMSVLVNGQTIMLG